MENVTTIINDMTTNGDNAKISAIFALGFGSFIFGMLPKLISQQNRRRFPLLISILLCFGAGVLLATALVHMLPDVRKLMPKNAEIVFGGGFFMIYFIDEFVHYFFGEAIQHTHGNEAHSTSSVNQNDPLKRPASNNYGTDMETQALLAEINPHSHHDHTEAVSSTGCREVDESNAQICHVTHTEPCTETMTGTLGLLCALSLHSFIEGLAIGVQDSKSKVLVLLTAVSCHKFVMGFCLGVELCANTSSTLKSHIIAIVVFSLGSMLGIGAGMIFVDFPDSWTQSGLPILQALAGGTLLYVTVCEVMPREKSRWHQNRSKKSAGIAQFLSVGLGFVVMTVINFYLDDD